jgi:endonuclease YncB( thermonuclease family)
VKSKFCNIIFVLTIFATGATSVLAQSYFSGQVIDVLDGKTMSVAVNNGTIKIQLDYIDVPEVGQPLNEIVHAHLKKLVLGKVVQYRARLISDDRSIGRVLLNGVDISQQMIRDGAAWHLPIKLSGQPQSEHASFAELQEAAKKDRLGIWAVPNLKPAWEFRDGITEGRNLKFSSSYGSAYVRNAAKPRPGKWGDVNPKLGNVGALYSGYNAESKTGFLSTGISMVSLNVDAMDERFRNTKLYADITYWYTESDASGRTGTFVLTLISENDTPLFNRNQELYLISEKGKILVGRGKRAESRSGGKVFEKMTFNVSRANMQLMANDVTVMKVADHLLEPQTIRYIIYNMLQST